MKLLPIRNPKRYKFLWGGRGGAKSESIAKELLRRGNKKRLRVLCTREIQVSIKDSVYSLLCDLIKSLHYSRYKITDNSIRHENGTEFIFMGMWMQEKKQTMKSFANIDICWVEEAQTISEGSLTLLDPTIRKKGSEIWFSFNRLFDIDPVWLFKNSIEAENKLEININYDSNPYLTKELEDQQIRSKREYDQGLNEKYLHVWLGEPVGQSEKTLLTLKEVHNAMTREKDTEGQIEIGVDVARFGNDRTVFIKRKGLSMIDYKVYPRTSVMETCRYLIDFVNNDTSTLIKIDDTGVGGGVTDYMKEQGFKMIPINFGSKANDSNKFNNKISEMWFKFKEIIGKISLLDLPELKSELVTREWELDLKGRRCIESKDKYKKRGYKSPDFADACLLCFDVVSEIKPVFIKGFM